MRFDDEGYFIVIDLCEFMIFGLPIIKIILYLKGDISSHGHATISYYLYLYNSLCKLSSYLNDYSSARLKEFY